MIESYFISGTASIFILALMAVEAVILTSWMKHTTPHPLAQEVGESNEAGEGRSKHLGPPPASRRFATSPESGRRALLRAMLWGLAAGATMILALSASIMHYSFELIGAFLLLSFVFHLLEVRLWLKTAIRLPA